MIDNKSTRKPQQNSLKLCEQSGVESITNAMLLLTLFIL